MVTLTHETLQQGMSRNGGWSGKQLRLLGMGSNPTKGWKRRLTGKQYPEEVIREFINLKDTHLNGKKKQGKRGYIEVTKPLTWEEQYTHPNWQRRRLEILKRDRFKCRLCLDKDSLLHVHHLKYDKSKWIWEIHEMYLVTLCHSCHEKEHGRKL